MAWTHPSIITRRALPLALAILAIGPVGGPWTRAAGDPAGHPVARVDNGDQPRAGVRTLALQEQWRIDSDNEGLMLGRISDALVDAEGNVYLLDVRLMQVHVISSDGAHLRSICRQGEGPGEVGNVCDMLWTPGDRLGVVQGFPGRIVLLERDGRPAGILPDVAANPAAVGINYLYAARSRGGTFGVCGERVIEGDGPLTLRSFLALWNADGSVKATLLTRDKPHTPGVVLFDESLEYFVDEDRWDLGPDGRLFAAPRRDVYEIDVFSPAGDLERTIARTFTSHRRSADEKGRLGVRERAIAKQHEMEFESRVEEYDPCVQWLRVTDEGELWVLSGQGTHDQPDGVLQTYDVFDRDGVFDRQVAVACPGDPVHDRVVFAGTRWVLHLQGGLDDEPTHGVPATETGESASVGVVCYQVAG